MNKILLFLLLVSVCLCSQETPILLENGVSLTNLNKLMTLDFNKFNCQTNLLQVSHQLKMWAELYQDEKVIHHEIRLLSTAHKILNQQRFNRLRNTNTVHRAKRILAALRHNTNKKQHTIYQQWRVNEIDQLRHSIQLLQTASTEDEGKKCCDRIEQLINKYLEQRKHIAKQCGNADVTINIINDAQGKIQIINQKCHENDPDVIINRADTFDKVIVGQSQQQKKEEQIVVTEQKQEQVVEEHHEQQVVEEHHEQQVVEVHKEQQVVEEHKEQQVVEQHQEQQVVEEHKQQKVVEQPQEQKVVEQPQEQKVVEVRQEQKVIPDCCQQKVVCENHQQQVVEEHHEQTETVTEETVEEEVVEETVIEETVTKTSSTKILDIPEGDDEPVEGQLVQAQGVGASGEGGRT